MAPTAMILFFTVPVILGLVTIFVIRRRATGDSANSQPLSSPKRHGGGRVALFLFGAVFAAIGAGFLVLKTLPELNMAFASPGWTETPCVIVSSSVESHSDSDGTTYSVAIIYRYNRDGRTFESNRYDAFSGSSSGYEGKAAIVSKYPAGSEATCYVNPHTPSQAVLKPGIGKSAWIGLVPLVFLCTGAGLMIVAVRPVSAQPAGGLQQQFPPNETLPGPRTLKSSASPLGKFAGAIIFTVIWNGLLSVFFWRAWTDFQRGHPDWFLTIFLTPFLLVGLAGFGMIIYLGLALSNPRIRLRVDSPLVRPGHPLAISWELTGAVSRLNRLSIDLEGREEASYTRGTSTYTDRRVFLRISLADVASSLDMAQGSASCKVPAGSMPTFLAQKNKILWSLKARGDLSSWPNMDEEFPIIVSP